jgi:hypothetical protein
MAYSRGSFIAPDAELAAIADPNEKLRIRTYSGHRARTALRAFLGRDAEFDAALARAETFDVPYEEQCSGRYYFDLFQAVKQRRGSLSRVVEVGVYMGGATSILAGCLEQTDVELDLVDTGANYLRYTHERIRRQSPKQAARTRLFHGDLPAYVRSVLLAEDTAAVGPILVHHDGTHRFDGVLCDLASLYYVRERLDRLIIQDTHLRGRPSSLIFVDAAVVAVFGRDLKATPIGNVYPEGLLTNPNAYEGNYFLAGTPEGMVIPIAENTWRYPHPSMPLELFMTPLA